MEKNYILYVDDDAINLELFKGLMEDDYNVLTESSTSKAFLLLEQHPVKVIISDQRMPEETGLSFLERVNKQYPETIKIIYTAYLDHDAALNAINQGGIFRYLMKPWSSEQMRITLDSAIREYDLKAENRRLMNELREAFEKIKENEQKFFNIFSSSNDAIVITLNHELVEANAAFLKLLDIETQNIEIEVINSYINRHFQNTISKQLQGLEHSENSITELDITIEGKKKFLELNSKSIIYNGKKAILSIIRDISDRKQHEYQIMEAIIHTQEEEQSRYARELHDGLGPILSTLKMYIEWLSDSSNTINKEKIAQQSIVSIDEAINMVKEIANDLSPHILQRFGLINALQTYTERVNHATNTEIVVSSNLQSRLPTNIETHLYRVLLECINNSIKHAQPRKILIKFKKSATNLIISYSDNGKGFNVQDISQQAKGMGLHNMQNRIKLLGGNFKITSNSGVGTDIEINLTV